MIERDFTLRAYRQYLEALLATGKPFLRFDEYMSTRSDENSLVLLRHDVDRKPGHSLAMANLESEMGVVSTYYFRARKNIFKSDIVEKIASLGHEIGYHYECLSDTNGDFDRAYDLFEEVLAEFRKIAPIRTISMHGSPLKPYDNRDLWRDSEAHDRLTNVLGLYGEVYLDIDYKDIAYINDTGRNWTSGKSNRRDQVYSSVNADFLSQAEMIAYLKNPADIVVFQVHPERWSDNHLSWATQYTKDCMVNVAKHLISSMSNK